jgi:dTDP-4-amino-4,6-dideoxygalactose transaminase
MPEPAIADSIVPAAAAIPPAPVISIASPWLPPWGEVVERFNEIWRRGRLTNGDCVERLEAETAALLGVRECVAVSSCTSGLMLAARCLGLQGEVILPSFMFFATGHALLWNGLTPVFGDCDPRTLNLDPGSAAKVVSRQTSAIVAVHNFGCPAEVEELHRLARRHGLRLVFDGAHAFGALVKGRGVAAWGDATVFSLAATKPLAAGEGGLIATADSALAARLRQARNYGNDGSYDCPILGLNARMTELQAALALAGLPHVEEGIERRRRLAALYQQYLARVPGLSAQQPGAAVRSTWNGFPLVAGPQCAATREAIEQSLAAQGVETRRYYDPPLHRQQLYRRFHQPAREPLEATDSISSRIVSLPLHAGLAPTAVERIARQIAALAVRGEAGRWRSANGASRSRDSHRGPGSVPKSVCAT